VHPHYFMRFAALKFLDPHIVLWFRLLVVNRELRLIP
jgi:hypothetical protein